jgi:putative membrane protein
MMLIGALVMVLFWGGVIALAFFAIRALSRPGRSGDEAGRTFTQAQTPLEILKARYARGEITREQYLEMRRDLET